MSKALITILALGAYFLPHSSQAACEPTFSGLDDMGLANIGASVRSLEKNVQRAIHCQTDNNCTFKDSKGIWYYASDGIVVRKEIHAESFGRGATLPGKLQEGDSFLDAVRKVEQESHYYFFYATYLNDGSYGLSSDLCLKNRSGEVYEFYVTFDHRGRVKLLGTRLEDEKD
jgi:hypothetical protein